MDYVNTHTILRTFENSYSCGIVHLCRRELCRKGVDPVEPLGSRSRKPLESLIPLPLLFLAKILFFIIFILLLLLEVFILPLPKSIILRGFLRRDIPFPLLGLLRPFPRGGLGRKPFPKGFFNGFLRFSREQ